MRSDGQRTDTITMRSRLILEAASALAGDVSFPYRQARVSFRQQGRGDEEWPVTFLASDTPDAIDEVAEGRAQVAIVNPAAPLALAYRGGGPYQAPVPVRTIAVIPSQDQLGFAVAERTGLTSLEEVRDRRYPLRLSLRRRNHSTTFVVRQVLTAAGFSLEDIEEWGGDVRYDGGLPDLPNRWGLVERGEVDAVFEEAMGRWADKAATGGLRFLSVGGPLMERLQAVGLRRGIIAKEAHPSLPADVVTVDFSGWPIFTHADTPEDWVYAFCRALEERKDRIPWQGEGPLPLERMCRDTPEGPIDVPLHPGAERFWRELGYL